MFNKLHEADCTFRYLLWCSTNLLEITTAYMVCINLQRKLTAGQWDKAKGPLYIWKSKHMEYCSGAVQVEDDYISTWMPTGKKYLCEWKEKILQLLYSCRREECMKNWDMQQESYTGYRNILLQMLLYRNISECLSIDMLWVISALLTLFPLSHFLGVTEQKQGTWLRQ